MPSKRTTSCRCSATNEVRQEGAGRKEKSGSSANRAALSVPKTTLLDRRLPRLRLGVPRTALLPGHQTRVLSETPQRGGEFARNIAGRMR